MLTVDASDCSFYVMWQRGAQRGLFHRGNRVNKISAGNDVIAGKRMKGGGGVTVVYTSLLRESKGTCL